MNQITKQMLNYFRTNVQQAIQMFDLNRDGMVNRNEVIQVLQQSGLEINSARQITDSLFEQLDIDHDGYLTLKDFQTEVNPQQITGHSSQLEQQMLNYFKTNVQQAIQTFDLNRDGMVDKNEAIQIFQQSGLDINSARQITESLFHQLDVDRNGYLTLKDFQA
ncbi:MAG: hypothetical protein F6J92_28945 [Symploca sp. SIO1A3]|nr:hypothetical protein [Symploca sp. SIO1A3]